MADAIPLPAKVATARSAILAEIASARILPGEQIDKTRWGYRLGLSAQPVSTALAILAEEGFASVVPQSGSYVARPSLRRIESAHLAMIGLAIASLRRHPEKGKDSLLNDLRKCIARAEALGRSGAFESAVTTIAQGMNGLVDRSPFPILRREQRNAALYHHWAMSIGYRTGVFQRSKPASERWRLLNAVTDIYKRLIDAVEHGEFHLADALVLEQHEISNVGHRTLARALPDMVAA